VAPRRDREPGELFGLRQVAGRVAANASICGQLDAAGEPAAR
jgi:hypothetical protein